MSTGEYVSRCEECGAKHGNEHFKDCLTQAFRVASNLEGLARRESMSTPAVGVPSPRPTWGQTFMDVADVFSRRATCPRLSVGALLVQEGGIPGPGGYNGARRGAPHCNDVGCDLQMLNGRESCQRAVHAEANAIFNAGRVGFKTGGSTLYVTAAPCLRCVDAIIQAGIIRVVYRDPYKNSGVDMLLDAGVDVAKMGAVETPYPSRECGWKWNSHAWCPHSQCSCKDKGKHTTHSCACGNTVTRP